MANIAKATRNYPNINFVDTDTETLVNSLIQSYEIFTKRTLYPADPARLFILWIADIIIQERVIINESAKQNVPRYAEGEYLDSLAENFRDTERLKATAATTTLQFYISAVQPSTQIVPQGTRVTVDGNITFETAELLTIKPGALYGDVPAVCQTVGTSGNGFFPGQIKEIVDVFPFYERVENITNSAGGAETETDDSFYERMRTSVETYSTAGPVGGYIYHAKTASSLVADVVAESPEPGIVDIRVLLSGGELPGEEILNLIETALSADKVRPLTDKVLVSAPETVSFDIDFTYYIPTPSASSIKIIAGDVEAAVQSYIGWQTEKMGRDINPSYLISLLMATGVKRVEIRSPTYTEVGNTFVAALQSQNSINGGLEDE